MIDWLSRENVAASLVFLLIFGAEYIDKSPSGMATSIRMRTYYDDAVCKDSSNKCWIITKDKSDERMAVH